MPSDSCTFHVARTASGLDHFNTLVVRLIRVRFFTPFGDPIANAGFRITLGSRVIAGRADDSAWAKVRVTDVPETCLVEWDDDTAVEYHQDDASPPAGDAPECDPADYTDPSMVFDGDWEPAVAMTAPPDYRYAQEIYLQLDTDDDEAATRRLNNLGFTLGDTLAGHVREFEAAYAKAVTSEWSSVKGSLWDWHDNGALQPCADCDEPQLA